MSVQEMRYQLTNADLKIAANSIHMKALFRAKQKGYGILISSHEVLGILTEEMTEFTEAVHLNQSQIDKIKELEDIAVAALFGIASIRSGEMDW